MKCFSGIVVVSDLGSTHDALQEVLAQPNTGVMILQSGKLRDSTDTIKEENIIMNHSCACNFTQSVQICDVFILSQIIIIVLSMVYYIRIIC